MSPVQLIKQCDNVGQLSMDLVQHRDQFLQLAGFKVIRAHTLHNLDCLPHCVVLVQIFVLDIYIGYLIK